MSKLSALNLDRRTEKKRDKLRRIDQAARALFAEHGYDATTTRAIARRAKIAAGTLFVYFPGKRELLLHLYRDRIDAAVEEGFASAAHARSPSEAVARVFRTIYAAYEEDMELGRVFVKEALFAQGEIGVEMAAWTASFVARLAALLDEHRARGAIDARVDTATAAYQIFAAYYLGLVSWLGSTALTAEHRDYALRASIAQLLER
jgi:AcrR family transcriptional regulator